MSRRKNKKKQTAEEIARKEEESGKRISGEPESNLAAVGAGGITGAAAGAVIGSAMGGPAGGAIGAAAGAVAGGAAADRIQDELDPKLEEVYWKENFKKESYYRPGDTYDQYLPAYRLGWESAVANQNENRSFEEIEPHLQKAWRKMHGDTNSWENIREIVRAGFNRVRARRLQVVNAE